MKKSSTCFTGNLHPIDVFCFNCTIRSKSMEKTVDSKTLELKLSTACNVAIPIELPLFSNSAALEGLCVQVITGGTNDKPEGVDIKFPTKLLAIAFAKLVNNIISISNRKGNR